MRVASRESLAEALNDCREVEVGGMTYRLQVPNARALAGVRKQMVEFSKHYPEDESEQDAMPDKDKALLLLDWTDIAIAAVSATLRLDGEAGPVDDLLIASQVVSLTGGEHGPVSKAALAQCGFRASDPEPEGDAGDGEDPAADGGPF